MSMLGLERLPPADESGKATHREAEDSTRRVAEDVAGPAYAKQAGSRTLPAGEAPAAPTHADTAAVADRLQFLFGSRFEVVKPIAIGGMATIFQLRHRLHGGLFVAKVLHPQLADKKGVIASFRTEARNAAKLGGHPHAVPIFDMGDLDGLFFILMPYIVGEDLDHLLERTGCFDEQEALQLAAQLSSLLSFAEAQGIVHCDLTPGNIRLDQFGNYRLLDFGISLRQGENRTAFAGGTPLYSSPEQLRGEPVDIRSDLYSLGAVLAEVLTGKPLFHADSLEVIRRRHLEGAWALPADLAPDRAFGRLLRHLLATDREQRIASAFELSGILDALGYPRPEFRRTARLLQQDASSTTGVRRRLSPQR